MAPLLKNILLTISLYLATVAALFLADNLSYRQGANDMSPSLEIAVICFVVILFFFFRSIYQSIWKDRKYWICVGIHLLGMMILASWLMF